MTGSGVEREKRTGVTCFVGKRLTRGIVVLHDGTSIDEFEAMRGKTGMFRKSLAENRKLGIRRGKWDLEAVN